MQLGHPGFWLTEVTSCVFMCHSQGHQPESGRKKCLWLSLSLCCLEGRGTEPYCWCFETLIRYKPERVTLAVSIRIHLFSNSKRKKFHSQEMEDFSTIKKKIIKAQHQMTLH